MGMQKGSKKRVVKFDDDCYEIDDDCYEIDASDFPSKENHKDSDDISVIAQKGKVALKDFPHPRHQCGNLPFATTSHESYCRQCYCLVCDKPAPKCRKWKGSNGHCHITQKVHKEKSIVKKSHFLKRIFLFLLKLKRK
ncbi:uncharacterized protein [Typha angustifolia]|uniref:uncharacterized protein n=1 Tax=Typha angustifolia TaxID=59011 RepID=UPI003C2D0723